VRVGGKRIIVGSFEWGIEDEEFESVVNRTKCALENGTVAELPLLDSAGRRVTVFLNGRVAETVVIDWNVDGRPSTFG
jgi:hypothetical protein